VRAGTPGIGRRSSRYRHAATINQVAVSPTRGGRCNVRLVTWFPTALPIPRTPDPAGAPALRWGILGPGGIASDFATAATQSANQHVVAVASRSLQRAEAFGSRFGITSCYGSAEQLVDDDAVQAVYVASPHSAHFEQALLALNAGKHVMVEKAFTENAAQAQRLVDAAAAARSTLMEAMWTRFLPGTDVVRQLLADGTLGTVRTVIADHGQYFDFDPDHRLFSPALAGGALLDLGVYPVSFASFALGVPDAIHAFADRTSTGVDGQVSAILHHQNAQALINATLFARTPTTATISGTSGRIEIGRPFYGTSELVVVSRDDDRLLYDGAVDGVQRAGLSYEIAHFASLVTTGAGESPLLPLSETVAVMGTMDTIRQQIGLQFPDETSPGTPAASGVKG
jgi:predicted dehydrogenase